MTVRDLAAHFGVAEMTLRRDLDALAEAGRVQRVHGGAIPVEPNDPGFRVRSAGDQPAKQTIATLAAGLLQSGQAVYLDSGSTADAVAAAIARRVRGESLELRLATHALNVALQLAEIPGISLTMLGGEISPTTLAAQGRTALQQLEPLSFDLFFMGASGVDAQAGWTNANPATIELKQAVHSQASRTCALVDSAKWGVKAFHRILPLDAVQIWLGDKPLPAQLVQATEQAGVHYRYKASAEQD